MTAASPYERFTAIHVTMVKIHNISVTMDFIFSFAVMPE